MILIVFLRHSELVWFCFLLHFVATHRFMAGKPFYTGECNVKIIPKKDLSFVCLVYDFRKVRKSEIVILMKKRCESKSMAGRVLGPLKQWWLFCNLWRLKIIWWNLRTGCISGQVAINDDCWTRPVQPSTQFLLYIPFIVTMTTILIIIILMTLTTTIVTMHILEAMITAIYGIVVGRLWPRGNMCRVIILSRAAPGILVVSALCAVHLCLCT